MTIRYFLYTDPSREHTEQLGPDVESDDLPPNTYGATLTVEGEPYIIANICHAQMTPCHDDEDSYSVVFQVFLARLEQWPDFREPEFFHEIWEQKTRNDLDNRQN